MNCEEEVIEVGDTVYWKKYGWSGVPMKVLELNTVSSPYGDGTITQALCCGTDGWTVDGLISEKYKVRVDRFAVANLTKIPNSMLRTDVLTWAGKILRSIPGPSENKDD